MANPNNMAIITGRLVSDPVFIKTKDGIEFATTFTVATKRNYKGKSGEYEADFLPIRYEGQNKMPFAHMLKKGDVVSVAGAFTSGSYKKGDETVYTLYVLAESIQFTPSSRKKEEPTEDVVPGFEEDAELPYK